MSEDTFGMPFNSVFRKLTLAIAFGLIYWWELGCGDYGASMVITQPCYSCDRNVWNQYFFSFPFILFPVFKDHLYSWETSQSVGFFHSRVERPRSEHIARPILTYQMGACIEPSLLSCGTAVPRPLAHRTILDGAA